MALESSVSNNVAMADTTFLGEIWEVATKLVASGAIELILFAASLIVALLMRSTDRVWASANKKKGHVAMPNVPQRVSAPPKIQPANPVVQLADDSISMRVSTGRVLCRYAELKAGNLLSNIDKDLVAAPSPHTVEAFFQSLVQCACRGSQPELVEGLLDDMEAAGGTRSIEFYESAMRLLAAKKCFKEALAVNDRLERDGLTASTVTQSCLVSFAAELGLDDKTIQYFERLCKLGPPSLRACMVVLRVHSKKHDWPGSAARFRSLVDMGVEIDGLCLNIVLATGVATGMVKEAEAFLSEDLVARTADTISYNTILKGLAQKGLIDDASRFFDAMEKRGASPNIITFNTMIDAAVRARNTDQAWRLYDVMQQSPTMKPDKCTCSTLVKALQHRPTSLQVKRTLELVGSVVEGCQKDLAGRLLSSVLYAALRISDVATVLETKSKILEQGFALSESDTRAIAQLQGRKHPAGF